MSLQKSATASPLDQLLDDATGCPPAETARAKYMALAKMLSAGGEPVSFRTVEKWFARRSVPGARLIRIAAASRDAGRPLDLAKYE